MATKLVTNIVNKLSIYPRMLKKLQFTDIHFCRNRNLTISSANQLSNTISDNTSAPKSFQFTDYDCLGFDLDNTICRFKVGPMMKMEYDGLAKFLVDTKKYPEKYLLRPMEENVDFLQKGLILDFHNGNVLKINSSGKIVKASHGTKFMSQTEIEDFYGKQCHWDVTDAFSQNLLATWNGPLSEKMRSLLDYFDMPTGLIFARLVDTLDEKSGKRLNEYNIWPDILAGLFDMYNTDNFKANRGGYFPNMKESPRNFIQKCDANLINWLKALKAKKKILFLITGSYVDFASLTSKTSMGDDWTSLFDVVIFYAKKPGFFTDNREFIDARSGVSVGNNELKPGGWYVQGNWNALHNYLKTATNLQDPKVAYIGDNLIQDVYTPDVHTKCDTVAIVEELEAEGVFGFSDNHAYKDYLSSKNWGSYFGDASEQSENLWLDIIRKHSKLCVPSMDFVTSKPIDFKFIM